MKALTLLSPAKVNLTLRVLGRRSDGYHELLTLFQRISLTDRIFFREIKKGFTLHSKDTHLPCDSRNLIYKAYQLLQRKTGLNQGIEVRLEKHIPLASGLGGGSSNAASTLLALNQIYRLGLRKDELISMGKELGADVPFFLLDVSQAVGKGRGDELTPVPFSTKLSLFLTFLPEGISTQKVYRHVKVTKNAASLTKLSCDATMLSAFLAAKNIGASSVLLRNDLLPAACQIKPAIGRVLSFLRTFWPASQMSGSGPTLFTLAKNVEGATLAAERVSRKWGFVTQPCRMY